MRIGDNLLRPEANNFTILRFILASSVIYSHSFEIIGGNYDIDGLSPWIGAPVSGFAVDGFFFLSGFLVYPSLQRLGNPLRFLGARLTRLWPALAFSVVAVVIGGAFFTTAHGLDYLKGDTANFIRGNLTFFRAFFGVTGVHCGNDLCNLNGSLWTLPWEMRCYLTLALLGFTTLASPAKMKWFVLPATVLFALAWDFEAVRLFAAQHLSPGIVFMLGRWQRLWPLFALGCAAYIWREKIVLSWWTLGGLFALAVLTPNIGVALQTRALFVGYMVLCFGLYTAKTKSLSGRWPDYSYGMYIYAFPVMMLIKASGLTPGYAGLALATLACTVPVAAFSWHVIEHPALDLFRRTTRRAKIDTTLARA